MFSFRILAAAFLLAGLTLAADGTAIEQTARLVEAKAAQAPKGQDVEFRLMAAQMLRPHNPALAQKFVDASLRELRAHKELATPAARGALAALAPTEAAAMFPPPPATASTAGARPVPPAELAAIQTKMGQMRKLPTDEDRARLVLEIVADIRALPPAMSKVGPISGLANLVTEGDLGKEALNAVASTLALALRENPGSPAFNYVELAKLIRYEHLTPLPADPSLDAATALLVLHDEVVQASGFTLTALDGKTYTLDGLRGKVVLLNFWATWCPPCRKEMPDLDSKGLVVLAVSDEKRETVEEFLAKQNYTFPVLLDAGRTVNTAFGIEGIPNSFLFDRNGKLVAQSIDMRTERQFLEMFKAAGLE